MKGRVSILVLRRLIAFVSVKRGVKSVLHRRAHYRGTKVQGAMWCYLYMYLQWKLGLKGVSGKNWKELLPRLGGSGMSCEGHLRNSIRMLCLGKNCFGLCHQSHLMPYIRLLQTSLLCCDKYLFLGI